MDVPRLNALEHRWKIEPPVGMLVAAYLGYEPPIAKEITSDVVTELVRLFPSGKIEQ
jgi:hypothetical protein